MREDGRGTGYHLKSIEAGFSPLLIYNRSKGLAKTENNKQKKTVS
jgi:hypothetical protein